MKIKSNNQYRDFSKGTMRTVQSSIVPKNTARLALNLDSDKELGSLVSRLGTDRIGSQAVASASCLGLSYFRDTVGTSHKLFGVFSDGVNSDIYDMVAGSKSLQDDTKDLKTRFCTFLDSIVRVNGTDAAKAYNGSSWITSGGAFDVANMPLGKVVMEWKDRVYTAGVSTTPNILYYSSIADPDTRTVSWTQNNGQIEIEQEDGGGDISAIEKVPGYLLVFKERTMKRWDGVSTNPEDLINIGAPSQEAVCRGRGMVFIANEEGVWVTNGSYPQRISKPIQDLWDSIPAANIASISTFCDERYVYVYVGDITYEDNEYVNICFKYNIDSQTWDIYSYYNDFKVFTWYLSSGARVVVGGDSDGQSLQINTGNTDFHSTVQPITWSFETHDIDYGLPGNMKEFDRITWFSRNIRTGQCMARVDSDKDADWQFVGNVKNDVEDIKSFKEKGNRIQFKLTGISDSGQVKLLGFELPPSTVDLRQNETE
jgi:hypothetical protein